MIYLLVRDDRLSGMRPGQQHLERLHCEPERIQVVLSLLRKHGYTVLKSNTMPFTDVKSMHWKELPRLVKV